MPELANDPECRLTLWQVDQVRSDFAIENDLQFIMGQLARVPDRGWLSRMLLLGGSADRSPTARPCRPATVFDFRPPPARGRAHASREGQAEHTRPLLPVRDEIAPLRVVEIEPAHDGKAVGVNQRPVDAGAGGRGRRPDRRPR